MPYTLATARRAILENWQPPAHGLTGREEELLRRLWDELKGVEAVGAWASVCTLSGKILEALLKARLKSVHGSRRLTLGRLIDLARSRGVFGDDSMPSGSSPVSTALMLRNWTAHASLWDESPTERQATQSLALLVCVLESLGSQVSSLADFRDDVRLPHIRVDASASRLDSVRKSVDAEFANFVRAASYASPKWTRNLILKLKSLQMRDHAIVLGILLPFDVEFIANLIRHRSPAYVAFYVSDCLWAEPRFFHAVTGNSHEAIVEAFWSRFGAGAHPIINGANILGEFPRSLQTAVMKVAPYDSLLAWIEASDPVDSINLLRSLDDQICRRAPQLRSLQDAVMSTLTSRLRRAPDESVARVPNRLHILRLAHQDIGIRLLRLALETIATRENWDAILRVIWDTYQYSDELAGNARDVAGSILARSSPAPPWHMLCLRGIVELAGANDQTRSLPLSAVAEHLFVSEFRQPRNRWHQFLATLGFARSRTDMDRPLPGEVVTLLAPIVAETRPGDTRASQRLLREMTHFVGE